MSDRTPKVVTTQDYQSNYGSALERSKALADRAHVADTVTKESLRTVAHFDHG